MTVKLETNQIRLPDFVSGDEDSKSKTKRTAKACDFCRQKKIKCDGQNSCLNCTSHKLVCTYNYVAKKRTPPKKLSKTLKKEQLFRQQQKAILENNSNLKTISKGHSGTSRSLNSSSLPTSKSNSSNSIALLTNTSKVTKPPRKRRTKRMIMQDNETKHDLSSSSTTKRSRFEFESRLNKMESMMEILLTKLVPESNTITTTNSNQEIETESDMNASSDSSADDGDDDEEEGEDYNNDGDDDNDISINDKDAAASISQAKVSREQQLQQPVGKPGAQDKQLDAENEAADDASRRMFFGHHSTISLFSPRGLKWIASKLKNPKDILPLKKLIAKTSQIEQESLATWIEPIEKSKLSAFPPREIIVFLLNTLEAFGILKAFMRQEMLERNFALYCDHRDGKIPEPRFTYSELLLMNTSLLIGCAVISDKILMDKMESSLLDMEQCKKLESRLLDNCLFYYHRVTLVFDGIEGIQAILMLVSYVDIASLSQAAFLLSSTAIRQAQEMGLHRAESYIDLPAKERENRIRVWWMCYAFDKELCLKSGKPPILNDRDISAPALPGFEKYWVPAYLNSSPGSRYSSDERSRQISEKLESNKMEIVDLSAFDSFISVELSMITSKAYDQLFSATAFISRTKTEIWNTVFSLLGDLERWRLSIPQFARPNKILHFGHLDPFTNFVESKTDRDLTLRFLILTLNLKYFYLQMIITKVVMRFNWSAEHYNANKLDEMPPHLNKQEDFNPEAICMNAARSMLILTSKMEKHASHYSGFLVFYPFCACLTLSAYILQNPKGPNVVSDIELLLSVCKNFFCVTSDSYNASNAHELNRRFILSNFSRNMLYFCIITATEANENLSFDVGDFFDDIYGRNRQSSKNESNTATANGNGSSRHRINHAGKGSLHSSKSGRTSGHTRRQSLTQHHFTNDRANEHHYPGSYSVASRIVTPPLNFQQADQFMQASSGFQSSSDAPVGISVDEGALGQQQQQQQQLPQSQLQHHLQQPQQTGTDSEQQELSHLLDKLTRSEDLTPYGSDNSNTDFYQSDPYQNEGGFLFQNVFSIPTYLLDMEMDMDMDINPSTTTTTTTTTTGSGGTTGPTVDNSSGSNNDVTPTNSGPGNNFGGHTSGIIIGGDSRLANAYSTGGTPYAMDLINLQNPHS